MKLPWRPLAQQQKNGTTIASNSTLTRTIQFGLYSCISACQLVVDDTCFSRWNSMLTLYLFLISVSHGSDVSRRYNLGHESIHRANYWYPLCSESMMNTHNQQIWNTQLYLRWVQKTSVRGWLRLIVVQNLLIAHAVVPESILLAFLMSWCKWDLLTSFTLWHLVWSLFQVTFSMVSLS